MSRITINGEHVFMLANSNYERLIDGGLKVTSAGREFFYSPGSWWYVVEKDSAVPNSPETEQTILGTILLYPDSGVQNWVEADDFYVPAHQAYLEVIQKLGAFEAKAVIDVLRQNGELDACGGISYFSALLDAAVGPENISHHLDSLKTYAQRRRALMVADELTKAADSGDIDRIKELCG